MNKILIIDDDVKLTELLDEFFSHHDFEIKCLHTPIKCLETIKQFEPNLIILDITLPDMDGFQVLRKMEKKG